MSLDWLQTTALPLWRDSGWDPATGTVWEALDHSGAPLAQMERRLRVQLRQAFCFATLGEIDLARDLFTWVMQHGFDPDTGNLAARLSPDMHILSAPHDLYDLAFAGLAAAALIKAGVDVADDLARIEAAIARLKAPRGWYEDASHRLPRRQNPHMHLFEAATELYAATGAPRFQAMAEECLLLFRDVFLQPDGRILEFYAADWTPLAGQNQAVEPGHMAEWIFLLKRYAGVSGHAPGIDLPLIWQAVTARRDLSGLLPDRSDPISSTRRLWPQTELLKAAHVMRQHGVATDVETIEKRFWSDYLEGPVSGGWYDQRSLDGALLSDRMPASTFYHIVVAFRSLISFDDGS